MATTLQSIREGKLISTLSDGLSISGEQVVQLRLQRLHDVLNHGKNVTIQAAEKPKKNIVKKILSQLIY